MQVPKPVVQPPPPKPQPERLSASFNDEFTNLDEETLSETPAYLLSIRNARIHLIKPGKGVAFSFPETPGTCLISMKFRNKPFIMNPS